MPYFPIYTVKTNSYLRVVPHNVVGNKVEQGESVIWLFLKINLPTTTSMKRSRRELSIDMVVHSGILKNNAFPVFYLQNWV